MNLTKFSIVLLSTIILIIAFILEAMLIEVRNNRIIEGLSTTALFPYKLAVDTCVVLSAVAWILTAIQFLTSNKKMETAANNLTQDWIKK
jgi:cytosine/uracil/thiamine/allantoin permease